MTKHGKGSVITDECTVDMPELFRQAHFEPSTFNEEDRTVELTWTTGAIVRRHSLFDGPFDEELSLEDGHVRLERLNNGANLLDSHQARELSRVLGVVEKAWIEKSGKGRVGKALVRFSSRPDVEPYFKDVRDGIIRNVSAGYAIHRAEVIEKKRLNRGDQSKIPLVRAVDWEPMELSMVAVPADAGARVRSSEDEQIYPCVLQVRSEEMVRKSSQEAVRGTADVNERDDVDEHEDEEEEQNVEQRSAPEDSDDEFEGKTKKGGKGGGLKKGGKGGKPTKQYARAEEEDGEERASPPQQQPVGLTEEEVKRRIEQATRDAIRARQERDERIRTAGRTLNIHRDTVERFLDSDLTADDVINTMLHEVERQRAADKIIKQPVTRIEMGEQDEEEVLARAITSTILYRYDPQRFKPECGGERFIGYTLLELGRHCLENAGVRTSGMSRSELAKRSMTPGYGVRAGLHTTSDFANVLADVANKTLRAAYDIAPRTFVPFTRRTTAPDFKTINRMQLGEAPALVRKNEHGEFQRGTVGDAKESYALVTYGRVFGITREVVVNDDLQAFTRFPALFGQAAAQKESDVVWAVLLANAQMNDGTQLFHANHGNLLTANATTGVINAANIGAARASMSKQTGLDGRTLINVMARFLIVPPELETVAEQLITGITPAQTSNVVPASIRSLVPISEPRLSVGVTLDNPDGSVTTVAGDANAWYLAADPAAFDTIEYAYLEGEEGVSIDSRVGFDVDGVEVRARLDFAAKAIDWRGLYRNDGIS